MGEKKGLNIAFVMPGLLPSPATQGGILEEWLDAVLQENERQARLSPTIFNVWDDEAQRAAAAYPHARFIMIQRWVRIFTKPNTRYLHKLCQALAGASWDAVIAACSADWLESLRKTVDAPVIWLTLQEDGSSEHAHAVWRYAELPPYVNWERFHPDIPTDLRTRWGLLDEDVAFLYLVPVGTQPDEQMLKHVLDSFVTLDMPYTRLLLANVEAHGPLARAWLRLPKETAKRVTFTGRLSVRTVPTMVAATDVVVCSNDQTAWEAMATGKPVIRTNTPLIPAMNELCGSVRIRHERGQAGEELVREMTTARLYNDICVRLQNLY